MGATLYQLSDPIVPTIRAFVTSLMAWPETPSSHFFGCTCLPGGCGQRKKRKQINLKIRLRILYLQAKAGTFTTIHPVEWLIWTKIRLFFIWKCILLYSYSTLSIILITLKLLCHDLLLLHIFLLALLWASWGTGITSHSFLNVPPFTQWLAHGMCPQSLLTKYIIYNTAMIKNKKTIFTYRN